MIFLTLFIEFFKTGLFAIGGGLATLPFLQEMGSTYGWFTTAELTRMVAVAESTPGPIGVNCATYVGYEVACNAFGGNVFMGVLGSISSTVALVLPSMIIISIIASVLKKFSSSKIVKNLFYGLRAGAVGLLLTVVISMCQTALLIGGGTTFMTQIDWRAVVLFAVMLFGVIKWKKHPLVYIGISAVVGLVFSF